MALCMLLSWTPVDDSFDMSVKRTVVSTCRHACALVAFVPVAIVASSGSSWSCALTWVCVSRWFEPTCAVLRCGMYAAGISLAVLDLANGALLSVFPFATWVFIGCVILVVVSGTGGQRALERPTFTDSRCVNCCVYVLGF